MPLGLNDMDRQQKKTNDIKIDHTSPLFVFQIRICLEECVYYFSPPDVPNSINLIPNFGLHRHEFLDCLQVPENAIEALLFWQCWHDHLQEDGPDMIRALATLDRAFQLYRRRRCHLLSNPSLSLVYNHMLHLPRAEALTILRVGQSSGHLEAHKHPKMGSSQTTGLQSLGRLLKRHGRFNSDVVLRMLAIFAFLGRTLLIP